MRSLHGAEIWLKILAGGSAVGAVFLFIAAAGNDPLPLVRFTGMLLVVLSFAGAMSAIALARVQASRVDESGALAQGGTTGNTSATTGEGAVARPRLTFADVAGLDDVLDDLKELVGYINERDKYLALDAKLPRGVLLYGPPGTGKTLLAKALAAEAGATFLYASGASFVEKYVGVGAQRIRELFAKARKQSPAVIFIDEIDSIGRARGHSESTEWDTSLNQLLTELDGFESSENVLLICATNRKETLDEALLRPGRLDRQIYIGLPDLQARAAILDVHTRKKPLNSDVDLRTLARRTPGLSGAHLAAVANEAALAAARCGSSHLRMADFDAALDRVMAGQTGRPNLLTDTERRLVAFHEAGHALVGWVLGQGAIEKITLLSRSQALGYVLQVPEERALHTRAHLHARIAVLLSGRAAEELITGDFTTGAADDLRKATSIAEKMVTEFGMGERRPHQVIREQSLVFSRGVAAEVNHIIGDAWERAQTLVRRHQAALERLATTLMERETLHRSDVEALLADVNPAA